MLNAHIFFSFSLFQEGPESISVHGKETRTTGTLESNNNVMGRDIVGNTHFFRFVFALIDFEYKKEREMFRLAYSGGVTAKEKRKQNIVRSAYFEYSFTFDLFSHTFIFFLAGTKRQNTQGHEFEFDTRTISQ